MHSPIVPWVMRGWVAVTLLLFTRFRPTVATTVALLGGIMFLPERFAFDAPGMPPLNKEGITYVSALGGCLLFARNRLLSIRPGIPELLLLLLVLGGWATALTNQDYLFYGPRQVRRLSAWDGASMGIRDMIFYGIPFVLGRALFRSRRDLRFLVMALVGAGLVYSLFVLWEFRMSPHLHKYTYGFHQNPYRFVARAFGFRPMVYMESGIAVGLFLCSTTFAAAALAKARLGVYGIPALFVTAYLFAMLLLCQSVASVAYTLLLLPAFLMLGLRNISRICLLLCALVITYPALRAYDVFPKEPLTELAYSLDEDRGESLAFRFKNEEILLEKAREQLLFGWGAGGRNRVYDERNGKDISTTDGFWILIMGSRGLIGWFVPFGLLLVPVVRSCVRLRSIPSPRDRALLMGLCMVVAIRAVDMLPNGMYTSLGLYVSGALYTLVPAVAREGRRSAPDPGPGPGRSPPPDPPEPRAEERPRNSALLTNSRADRARR